MALTPPPTLRKPGSGRPTISSKIAVVLVVLILTGALAGGWIVLRRARASREEAARREKSVALALASTPTQAAREDLAAGRALAGYLGKIQAQLLEHDTAFRKLKDGKVLAWDIHDRADIEKDRQIVRDFLATNQRLTESIQYGADLVRADLNTANVPPAVRDSALALYQKSQAPLAPLQLHVYRCDQALGENALAVLDMLDFNWGKWRRDSATGRIDFDNTILIAAFQDYVGKIQDAVNERASAVRELSAGQKSFKR